MNAGFILIRCGEQAERFFTEVGDRMMREKGKNEQAIENEMLAGGFDIPWGHLPLGFVARTHGWPPRREMTIYHANYTLGADGVGQKIRQFKAVQDMQRYGMPAIAYHTAMRVMEKSLALLGIGKTG